jgi:hypothetical protein
VGLPDSSSQHRARAVGTFVGKDDGPAEGQAILFASERDLQGLLRVMKRHDHVHDLGVFFRTRSGARSGNENEYDRSKR